jgi:hypothetical protein
MRTGSVPPRMLCDYQMRHNTEFYRQQGRISNVTTTGSFWPTAGARQIRIRVNFVHQSRHWCQKIGYPLQGGRIATKTGQAMATKSDIGCRVAQHSNTDPFGRNWHRISGYRIILMWLRLGEVA